AFQAYDEGSIPFTRSNTFECLASAASTFESRLGYLFESLGVVLRALRRRPRRLAVSVPSAAPISMAHVRRSVLDRPVELSSLAAQLSGAGTSRIRLDQQTAARRQAAPSSRASESVRRPKCLPARRRRPPSSSRFSC